ncbi:MAG TPA: isochorismatase family cysteine hydrolase [Gemmatimonadaceae bacterium]|nr:isochorismatase family cysteine hydrolase [Gemmatimonadaceae bacterium]
MARTRTSDPYGHAPDTCAVALLIIDAINDLEFPGGRTMLPRVIRRARRIAALKRRTSSLGIPTVYVNDNFGRWRSDFRRTVAHCVDEAVAGRPVASLLIPGDNDYFVLKPKHSGFYSTTLDLLLDYLHAETLILTGMASDVCVLYTAADAYMRDLRVIVARDCVTALTPAANRTALAQMRSNLKADVVASSSLDARKLKRLTRLTTRRARLGGSSGHE